MAASREWNYDGVARKGDPTEAEIREIEAEKAKIRAENAENGPSYRPRHHGRIARSEKHARAEG